MIQPSTEILVVPWNGGVIVQLLDIPTQTIYYAQRYASTAGAQKAIRKMLSLDPDAPIPTTAGTHYIGALARYNLGVEDNE